MQGNIKQAVQNWERGVMIAEKLEQPDLQKSMLARLRNYYADTNQIAELRAIETQLASVTAERTQ
jgi:hypothetical protein